MLQDWIELCRLFNDQGVDYLLVGGQAVIAHGYPRLTKDLDLWVRPTRDNGLLVLEALTEFGAPVELAAAQFENPRTLLVLGREPFRVDILTSIRGIEFDRAWPGRSSVTLEGVTIPLIAKADLITNKQAVGRLRRRPRRRFQLQA